MFLKGVKSSVFPYRNHEPVEIGHVPRIKWLVKSTKPYPLASESIRSVQHPEIACEEVVSLPPGNPGEGGREAALLVVPQLEAIQLYI